jgi:SPP1 gp7 family putative phage head morphogenesis protein
MPDQTDAVVTHIIAILRVAEGLRGEALEILADLEEELVKLINRYAPESIRGAKLRALLEQTQESITAAYTDLGIAQTAGLKEVAKAEGKFAITTINGKIGIPLVSAIIPETLLAKVADSNAVFGHSAKEWWKAQQEDLQFKFVGAMRQGILQGESVAQLSRRVRGTKAGGFEDGIISASNETGGLMPAKRRQAEALVRTSVISVSNEAKIESYKQLDDVVKSVQWVSTLDARTTPICRSLSGLIWKLPDYEPVQHDKKYPGPTAHFNCRSTTVAVLKSFEELGGRKLPSLDNKTVEARMKEILRAQGMSEDQLSQVRANVRASMDGPISKDITMDEWMKGKSDAFLNKTLGPGRAELFRAGKITMRDLTDQSARPLTLAQLRAL